jgi:hypothetical protein
LSFKFSVDYPFLGLFSPLCVILLVIMVSSSGSTAFRAAATAASYSYYRFLR